MQINITNPNLVALVRSFRAALEHCPKDTADVLHEVAAPHIAALNDMKPAEKAAEPPKP